MRIFVRFPRDENNRVVEFKDMPVICQPVYLDPPGRVYKVTEITRVSQPGYTAAILVRRSGQ